MNRSIVVLLFVFGCADATAPSIDVTSDVATDAPIVFEPNVIENSFATIEPAEG